MKSQKISQFALQQIIECPPLCRALTDLNPTFFLYVVQDRQVTPRELDVICAYLNEEPEMLIDIPVDYFNMISDLVNPKNNKL